MKIFERIGKKVAGGATEKVRTEVKKTVFDLIPAAFGIASMVLGFVIFRRVSGDSDEVVGPSVSNTHITTNNYFFQDLSEETIRKILSEEED